MTDPAIEAAQRAAAAWRAKLPTAQSPAADRLYDSLVRMSVEDFTDAAREALAPLRVKHQRVQRPDGTWRCTSCRDAYGSHADFPTGTDRLIYSSAELAGIEGFVAATVDLWPGPYAVVKVADLEEVWDDGNATGLDGWTGPGRGSGEVDDEAIRRRDRVIRKVTSARASQGGES